VTKIAVAGALRAAFWVILQNPGQYSMRDVLFGD
jgi:dihydrodipicolinate reductase